MNLHARNFRVGLLYEKHKADSKRIDFREQELLRYITFVRYSKSFNNGQFCNLNDYLDVEPTKPLKFDTRKVVNIVAHPIALDRQHAFRRLIASGSRNVIVPNDDSELAILSCIDDVFPDILVRSIESELLRSHAGLLEGSQLSRWNPFVRFYKSLSSEHKIAEVEVGSPEPEFMPLIVLNIPSDKGNENVDDFEGLIPNEQSSMEQSIPLGSLSPGYKQVLVINSRNPIMKELLEYKESLGLEEVDEVLSLCLHECYHIAVTSALDALPGETLRHHVELTCELIKAYLKSQAERSKAEISDSKIVDQLAVSQDELKAYKRYFGELTTEDLTEKRNFHIPPEPVERLGVVAVCNIVGSPENLVRMDFHQRGLILSEFVKLAKEKVAQNNGFFDKFTGDGLIALFGIESQREKNGNFSANDWHKACNDAWVFSQSLESSMFELSGRQEIRRIMDQNSQVSRLKLRIALSAGSVLFGSFSSRGTAVGDPVIFATQLCSEKGAFDEADSSILIDDCFQPKSGLGAFDEVNYDFRPRGASRRVHIYRSRSREE